MSLKRAMPVVAAFLALAPGAAVAHEGHGPETSWAGVVHWLSSPYHLVGVVALVAVVGGLLVLRAARRSHAPGRAGAVEEG